MSEVVLGVIKVYSALSGPLNGEVRPSYFCSLLWRPRQLPAFSGEKQIGTVTQSLGEGTQIDAVDQNRSGAVAGGAAVGNDGALARQGRFSSTVTSIVQKELKVHQMKSFKSPCRTGATSMCAKSATAKLLSFGSPFSVR